MPGDHFVTIEWNRDGDPVRYWWVCTCGSTGEPTIGHDRVAAKGRAHVRAASATEVPDAG